jgi:hypothetical protein
MSILFNGLQFAILLLNAYSAPAISSMLLQFASARNVPGNTYSSLM